MSAYLSFYKGKEHTSEQHMFTICRVSPMVQYFTDRVQDLGYDKPAVLTEDVLEYFDVDWLWNYYVVKRVENKIWQRTIAPDVEYAKELGGLDKKHLRDMRLCSKEQFPMYVDVTLYGGRFVGIMSFKDGLGLIIESEGIYKTLKSIFEMNWLMLEK